MLKARRTSLLVAACCIVAAGITLALLQGKPERPDVKLVFLGYTNESIRSFRSGGVGYQDESSVWFRKVVIGITNYGDTPALPFSKFQVSKLLGPGKYLDVPLAPILPGKMVVTTAFISDIDDDWEAELAFTRMGFINEWIREGKNSKISAVRSAARMLPSPKLRWAQSVRISNPPPSKRYHITAPPPAFKLDPVVHQTNQQSL